MESMTGYGNADGVTDQFSFSITLKSLNSKYLEIYTHLPRALKDHGEEIEAMLKKTFGRGKIELSVEIFDWVETKKIKIDGVTAKSYYDEFSRLEKKLGLRDSFNLGTLLEMDGVIRKERALLSSNSFQQVMKAIEGAASRACRMRMKDGASTARDIRKSIAAISKGLGELNLLTRDLPAKAYERLKNAVEALSGGGGSDERLYAEIAILADKLDINEEKVRLGDHIEKFKAMMAEDGQVGKRLDFLAQEMFREINTISSKSNSSKIAHIVVELKNHVDKIREHCRNIV